MTARDPIDQDNQQQTPTPSDAQIPDAKLGAHAPKKRRRIVIGALLLLGTASWWGHWYMVGRHIESTDNAYLQADSVSVSPKVGGYVAEVFVHDNQTVAAGQPLIKVDGRNFTGALDQANATIAARRADVARVEADMLQQQSSIAQARALLEGARQAASYAAARLARYEPLIAQGGETADRLAEVRNASQQASATVAAHAAALQAAQRQTASNQAQLQQVRAQLQAAQASARQSQADLDDTIVRSTLAGRVGDRTVRAGQFVQPGTRLMTVVPTQDIYLVYNFKETQVGAIRAGQQVAITVDALPGAELHGTVDSFAPGTGAQFALLPAENATGNFTKIVQRIPVRIRLTADQQERQALIPGMSVTVRVDTRSQPSQNHPREQVHG